MGIIRGRVYHDREIVRMHAEVGGPSPWRKCEATGEWFDKETGEQVDVVEMSLPEFVDKHSKPCAGCGKKDCS